MLRAAKHAQSANSASGAATLSLVLFAVLALSVRSSSGRSSPAATGTNTLGIVHMLGEDLNAGFDDMSSQPTFLLRQDNHRTVR
jgi:hypothetical protein